MIRTIQYTYRPMMLTLLVLPLSALMIGCPGEIGGTPCGLVTIQRTSDDANNTEAFSPYQATDCLVTLDETTLNIDILDGNAGTIYPRVFFTLEIEGTSIPTALEIDLARENDTDVPPALYQEYDQDTTTDPENAAGPFWSSLDENAGSITFSTEEDGSIIATFQFDADNPVELGNDARGTLRVTGEVRLSDPISTSPCGMGMPAMILIMMGLSLMRVQRMARRHR